MEHVPGYPDLPRTSAELDKIAGRYLRLHVSDGINQCAYCETSASRETPAGCKPRQWALEWLTLGWTAKLRRVGDLSLAARFRDYTANVNHDRAEPVAAGVTLALVFRSYL